MKNLDKKKCTPCEGGLEALSIEKSKILLKNLDKEWNLDKDAKFITKTFSCKNHYALASLINLIIHISHSEDHHPEITFSYNTASVKYFTYAINGLSENDFICAAKVDKIISI